MPVNKEELIKDLEAPEYLEVIKTTLGAKKFHIMDEAAHTEYLNNFKKDVIEKEIPAEISKVHTAYDTDIKGLFEIDRNKDEKSFEYLKRAAKVKLDGLNAKITEYEEQIKKGDTSGALTKKLQETEERAAATIKELTDKLASMEGQTRSATIESALSTAYAGIKSKFKTTLPPLFAQTEKFIIDSVKAGAILKDGVLYVGENGTIKKDRMFKEIKVEDYLAEQFKDVIDVRKAQGGAGSSGKGKDDGGKIDPATINADNFELVEGIKTQEDLMTHMLELGIPRGSKEFNAIWNKFRKELTQ